MSDATWDLSTTDDDLDPEALAAIQAAFGDDALDLLDEESPAESSSSLDRVLADIDAAESVWSAFGVSPPTAPAVTLRRFVGFRLAGEDCFVPLESVCEVQQVPRVSFVPFVPAWLLGVCNLRGQVVSVVDLRAFLGLSTGASSAAGRVLVVHSDRHDVTAALRVDHVSGIRPLDPSRLEPVAGTVRNRLTHFTTGVVRSDGRLASVLDLERLLGSSEFRNLH